MADESETTAPKSKGGRPRKHPAGDRRSTLTFRVRRDMHKELTAMAAANERSISEEVEAGMRELIDLKSRKIGSDHQTLLGLLDASLTVFEKSQGGLSLNSPDHIVAVKEMLSTVLDHLSKRSSGEPGSAQRRIALALLDRDASAKGRGVGHQIVKVIEEEFGHAAGSRDDTKA